MQEATFEWVGGEPCLDFNNTVSWNPLGPEQDRIGSHEDFVAWGRTAGLAPDPAPASDPKRALADARELRGLLHRILSPLSRWHAPAPEDLVAFNRFLKRALAGARIARGKGIFAWDFAGAGRDLDPILAGVVWSAAGLLASPELRLLRECANSDCGWLFVDRSRRKNRRWCEMRECGNRAKARRYYRRHRPSQRGEESPRAPLSKRSNA